MSWVAHFLDTNNLIQLNQDVLTKVERRYGPYPFTVMWSSLPYSAYHFSDKVKNILKLPSTNFSHLGGLQENLITLLEKIIERVVV